MRHHNKNKKFGRERDGRRALMKSLIRSLILEEKILTTEAKAKAVRPLVEKIITRGREDNVHNRRVVMARLNNDRLVTEKIFKDLSPRYKDRKGGYTRILKIF